MRDLSRVLFVTRYRWLEAAHYAKPRVLGQLMDRLDAIVTAK